MFIKNKLLPFLLLTISSSLYSCWSLATEVVNVPDDKFRACLNDHLGKLPAMPLTDTELAGLTGQISCAEMGIADITGAENLINVTYLNVEYNIKEIKNKIDNIIENLKKLELGESIIELKTFIEYFNELYNDFDKEKECKDLFRQNIKDFSYKIDNINKVVRDIYLQIDDIKYNYNLSDEDINKFSILNKNLEKIVLTLCGIINQRKKRKKGHFINLERY